jgi:5-methylcytosine-specific restriction endonuclease McrA
MSRSLRQRIVRNRRLRVAVIATYGVNCWLCGKPIVKGLGKARASTDLDGFSVDHVVPVALGGTNDLDNLRPAHRQCNNERHWRYGDAVKEAAAKGEAACSATDKAER